MTDDQLYTKLLATQPDKEWTAGWNARVPRNPEGPQAVARIEQLEAWKLAVDHRLVSAGCNTADSYSTPAEAIDTLIKQEIALSCDPLINGGADDHDG